MQRHTPSFILSLVIHLLFAGVVFLVYIYTSTILSSKKEQKICIQLGTIEAKDELSQEHTITAKKNISKPIKQKSKVIPQQKQKQKKVIKKKNIPQKQVIQQKSISPKPQTVQQTPPKEETTKKETTASQKPITPQQLPQQNYEQIYIDNNMQKIAQLLYEHLYYPRRARRHGIEGVVEVSFVLDVEGRVSQIKINSSQHDILSHSAIKTLNELSGKFPKPKEPLHLRVPIRYSLH